VIVGATGPVVTVKLMPLLVAPPTVTTTLPVVAPAGTGAVMLVVLQFVGVAAFPLNATELVPCVAAKFAPAIVTEVPTGPVVGFKLAMLGTLGGGGAVAVALLPLTSPEQPATDKLAAAINRRANKQENRVVAVFVKRAAIGISFPQTSAAMIVVRRRLRDTFPTHR
jgi:hypothetical protein